MWNIFTTEIFSVVDLVLPSPNLRAVPAGGGAGAGQGEGGAVRWRHEGQEQEDSLQVRVPGTQLRQQVGKIVLFIGKVN